jgi:hypothetical protein
MVRVNLLESHIPLPPATPREILEVCFCALMFTAGMGIMAYGVVRLLEAIK